MPTPLREELGHKADKQTWTVIMLPPVASVSTATLLIGQTHNTYLLRASGTEKK
jgi:hypothetical protein